MLRSTHSLMSLRPAPVSLPGAHFCVCVHTLPSLQALPRIWGLSPGCIRPETRILMCMLAALGMIKRPRLLKARLPLALTAVPTCSVTASYLGAKQQHAACELSWAQSSATACFVDVQQAIAALQTGATRVMASAAMENMEPTQFHVFCQLRCTATMRRKSAMPVALQTCTGTGPELRKWTLRMRRLRWQCAAQPCLTTS